MNKRFETTDWSLVVAAGGSDTSASRRALAALCETYWFPVYAFVRRQGHGADESRDLTQAYFLKLLEKDYLKAVDRQAGRFRSFLLVSVRHFLANEWDRAHAQKRAPPETPISLDAEWAEDRYRVEPADPATPERVFELQWARTLLERSLARLGQELTAEGKAERFEGLKSYLTGDDSSVPYSRVAVDLGMREGAVKTAIHRMRRRFGQLLQEEIARTVADPGEVEGEIRHLLSALEG